MATRAFYVVPPEAETPAISCISGKAATSRTKKKLIRRIKKDRSAIYRRSFQGAFLLLNLRIAMQFYDEGQGLSEHTSPFDALVFLLEGGAEITVSGKPIVARSGGFGAASGK